ncbi:MAG: hypothetical protein H0V53_09465 [Rubrobacter sp.]|nr:hypothetical protein [Rubrobacter sp.]
MSEGRNRRGFFHRLIFGGGSSPDERGLRELEESGDSKELGGFTVEKAAEVIKDLPEEVPRQAAVRIVRQTLIAAGIKVEELGRSTRMRQTKLESRIELSQNRMEELEEKTEEVVNSLQDQIEKAQEARDYGVSEEERRISEANQGLKDVELVQDFFEIPEEGSGSGLAEEGGFEPDGEPVDDETQVLEPLDDDKTRIIRRQGPLADDERGGSRSS